MRENTMSSSRLRSGDAPPSRSLSPNRIAIARQRRGLTKTDLARQLGVSPRTVNTYENNGAPLSRAADLSGALSFPVGFFQRPDCADLADAEVNFRAGRATTAIQRKAAKAAGAIAMDVADWIAQRFSLRAPNLPDLSGHDPRTAARMLREAWGLGTGPLPNLVQLSEFHGLRVFSLPALAEEVDAYSVWQGQTPFVFLARRKTPERSRFDVAHELGHLTLHRHEDVAAVHEREADIFASEFLMPRTAIIEHLPQNPSVDELMDFKTVFRVSAMAATYTSHKVGWLSDWAYRQNCAELERRGYRNGEPEGMPIHETSRVFPQVFGSKRYSVADAATDLCLPVGEVHALTFSTALRVVGESSVEPMVNVAARPAKLRLV